MSPRYAVDTSGPLHKVVRVELPAAGAPERAEPTPGPVTTATDFFNYYRERAALRERLFPRAERSPRDSTVPRLTGAQLLRARQVAGLTQRNLAPALVCSRSAIADAERGVRRPLEVHARWAAGILEKNGEEVAS